MNNRRIGFDRELNLNWLDLTAGLVLEGLDRQRTRQELLERLADEIPGDKARKNTISVLTRIWVRLPQEQQSHHSAALALLPHVSPEDRLWLHWGMSLLAYPFFHDVAGTVGRLFNLQGECESTQVLRRMREAWGHRSTLERAVQRLLHTFLSWGVTRSVSSTGHLYQATSPRQTSNSAVALWFLECVLRSALEVRNTLGASSTSSRTAGEDAQLPFMDLIQSPAAFPFDLTAHAVTVRRSGRFAVQRQGLDLEMISLPSID